MVVKEPKVIIRNLFSKYAKIKDNVVYAEKLFIINTIINDLFKEKAPNKSDLMYYGEIIDRYLKDELDITWKDGRILISEIQQNGKSTGE